MAYRMMVVNKRNDSYQDMDGCYSVLITKLILLFALMPVDLKLIR